MAFAAPFARPASSRFPRPGPASLWAPPRPFPALLWLAQRPTVPLATVPARTAAVPAAVPPEWVVPPAANGGRSSPSWAAAPTREPAGTEAGATVPAPAGAPGKARKRVPGEPPRLDLELRLLFSWYAAKLDEDFFTALRIELGARAWSLDHAIGAPRLAWSPAPGTESDLEKLRARLVTEVNLGLAIVESGPTRYPRPVRNKLLAEQARHIGRRLAELLSHPGAGSLADELQRLLDALQRRR